VFISVKRYSNHLNMYACILNFKTMTSSVNIWLVFLNFLFLAPFFHWVKCSVLSGGDREYDFFEEIHVEKVLCYLSVDADLCSLAAKNQLAISC